MRPAPYLGGLVAALILGGVLDTLWRNHRFDTAQQQWQAERALFLLNRTKDSTRYAAVQDSADAYRREAVTVTGRLRTQIVALGHLTDSANVLRATLVQARTPSDSIPILVRLAATETRRADSATAVAVEAVRQDSITLNRLAGVTTTLGELRQKLDTCSALVGTAPLMPKGTGKVFGLFTPPHLTIGIGMGILASGQAKPVAFIGLGVNF